MLNLIRLTCLIALSLGSLAPVFAQSAGTYEVGTRIALPSADVVRFELNAAGPSVLWIGISGGDAKSVEVSTLDAKVRYRGGADRLWIPVPLYNSGSVLVIVKPENPRGTLDVVSVYGIGANVTLQEILAAHPAPSTQPSTRSEDQSGRKTSSERTSSSKADNDAAISDRDEDREIDERKPAGRDGEEIASPPELPDTPVSIFRDASDTAPTAVEDTPSAPPEVPEPTPLAISNDVRPMDFSDRVTFSPNSSDEVATYRVYIPNRVPFRIRVVGKADIRVTSENGSVDRSAFGGSAESGIRVSNPKGDYFLVSVRASEDVVVISERIR